jgi:hypothetical protein
MDGRKEGTKGASEGTKKGGRKDVRVPFAARKQLEALGTYNSMTPAQLFHICPHR